MSGRRPTSSAEFKVETAHKVVDNGRPVAEVVRELMLSDELLANEFTAGMVELSRLRKQVSELEKDNAFLGKVSAHFAANPPKRSGLL